MKKENKKLLEDVIKDRLTKSLGDSDEASEAFKEAMEAIDRQNTLDKDSKDRIVKFVEIGTGNLDLDECYRACVESGVEYIIIEQDSCDIDLFESAKISFENLKKIVIRTA